jgi:DNA polymerase-3 subunit delta'
LLALRAHIKKLTMSWRQVRGHDDLIAAFGRAVARGRLAHAYLFVGPPGVGKRLFARQLGKTLLCESPPAGRWDSCDACAACALVVAGTHPDLFAVARPDEKLEMPIEVIRELCNGLSLKPARGGRKIAIVDDADDLNEESANSFLKTLEEPPPGSLLVLIGTSVDRQLATVRSRCQVIPFAPLTDELVEELLRGDALLESADVARLARLSGGSPGLARDLADPKLWAFRTQVLEELARAKPDSPKLFREWQSLLDDVGKDAGAQRRRASLVLRLLIDGFRDALRIATSGADARSASEASKLAERFGEDGLLRRLERCLEADFQIDRRVQLVLVLESLLDALV